ncbi:transposase [Streptomyces sp. NPDC006288]|uniref:transposase n=2 Tax=unclassified Streptomyces TaxID=2593676 RepID=UPI0033B9067E
MRPGQADDATAVTATQFRDVLHGLRESGQWREGDPEIWVVMDSGYDIAVLSHALADLPVVLVGRLRSDRVMLRDPGFPPHAARRAAGLASTAASSPSPGPTAGTDPRSPRSPTPPTTARPRRWPGTGGTADSPTAAPGWTWLTNNSLYCTAR